MNMCRKTEEFSHYEDAGHGSQTAGKDADQDRCHMSAQHMKLTVQRDGEAYGGRCQEPCDHIAGRHIGLVGNMEQQQKTDDSSNRQKDGIEQGKADFFGQADGSLWT